MTLEEIQRRLDKIRRVKSDYEVAHAKEDSLHQDVLEAIADDMVDDPRAAARLALTSLDIEFARYCA